MKDSKQRKFKSLVTFYYDYDSDGESVDTQKPEKGADYTFARKGSVFIMAEDEDDTKYYLKNKKMSIEFRNDDEIDEFIKDGWLEEVWVDKLN